MKYLIKITSQKYNDIHAAFTYNGDNLPKEQVRNLFEKKLMDNGIMLTDIHEVNEDDFAKYYTPFNTAYEYIRSMVENREMNKKIKTIKRFLRSISSLFCRKNTINA